MMPAVRKTKTHAELLWRLAALENDAARKSFLSRHKRLLRSEYVRQLADIVVEKIRVNTGEALRLAEGALLIAQKLRGKKDLAVALRAKGDALYACGKNRLAVTHHEKAFRLFDAQNEKREAARTLSHSIQPCILLGEYERAFRAAEKARETFDELGETLRIASLDNNVGNIFHRQDRFEQALAHYERAYQTLAKHEQWERVAITLHNMAMCLISLNDFPRSLDCYQKARDLAERYGMPLLRDQADYNIAYLYYFRGEYSRAIEMLFATRRACEANGDAYHVALCYMDLSEIYLELNLSEEARQMAREAFARFQTLSMGYEAAKSLANEAIACGQQGKTVQALEGFAKAREMFEKEKNAVWPRLLDLYQGLLLFHEGRHFEARKLCGSAASFFDRASLPNKAAFAHLILGRIALQVGETTAAKAETDAAMALIDGVQSPALAYQAHFLEGHLAQIQGERAVAVRAYREARKFLETLRSRLNSEELKISFVKNRLQVYEALVELHLTGNNEDTSVGEVFSWIEAAKSRSMTEMIFQAAQGLPLADEGQSELVRRIRDLREELNWYYHRIEIEQLRPEENANRRVRELREKALAQENELLRTLRELPSHERENAALEAPADFSLERLQRNLPVGATLIEYYSAGDRLIAALVSKERIEIIPVSLVSRVAHLLHLFRFQISKFRMGTAYTQRFEKPLLASTEAHLKSLYDELFAPLRDRIGAKYLIFVPHGALHFLPFHALRNDQEYLCDAYRISYAPSATVFTICQERTKGASPSSLVIGIPDERAPHILGEVQSVAPLLPQAELLIGSKATAAALRQKGATSSVLHIATHGSYRHDNPMFSAIRLGDGYLNLYDLYQMRFPAKLVTLSGCATGMNFVSAGDELLGLQRGLFCAGAASLLLSLWDVHDETTAKLMRSFYERYIPTEDIASALQIAMQELREDHPHPYFWAPFVLVGQLADHKGVSRT
jgi:CHAT domain-containing protein/predicted negative regulator of RcsB-dependent stress response